LSVADAHAQLCGSSGYYCLGASGASATVAVVAEPKPTVVADNQPNLSIGEARARAGSAGVRRVLERQHKRNAGLHAMLRPPPAGPLPFMLEAPLIAPLRPASATARLAGLEASVQAGPRRALHAMSQRYRSKAGLASSRLFRAEPHSSIAEEPAPLSPEDGEAALPADYEIALAALAAAAAADPLGGASDENQDLPIGRPPPPLGHVSKLLSAYATPQTTVVRSRYARQRHWDASTAVDDDRHAVGETLGAPGAALITAPGAMTSSTGELAVDCFGTKPAAGREVMATAAAPAPTPAGASRAAAGEELRAATGGAPSLRSWMESLHDAAPVPPLAIDPPRARTRAGAPAADSCVTVQLAHTSQGFRGMSIR